MTQQSSKTLRIVTVALMAAVIFVSSKFLSIPLPTVVGSQTRIHLGNVFCILSGLLFGAWNGGTSSGIGSALMDLTDPLYFTSTPTTFINKFLMGFVAGKIAHHGKYSGEHFGWNLVAAIAGQATYIVLYLSKTFIELSLLGNSIETTLAGVAQKALVSSTNGLIAVAIAVPLSLVLRKALERTNIFALLIAKPVKE